MKKLLLAFFLTGTALFAGPVILNRSASYPHHLQGVAADETGLYFTFTDVLVKTDYNGKVLKEFKYPAHMGDMCIVDGDLFISTEFRTQADITSYGSKSAVLQFSKELELKKSFSLKIPYSIDGITFCKGKFYIAPSRGKGPHKETGLMLFDRNFKFLKEVRFKTGTNMKFGAQNLTAVTGGILAAFYDDSQGAFIFDPETWKIVGQSDIKPATGFTPIPEKIAGRKNIYMIGGLKGKRGDYKIYGRTVTLKDDFKTVNFDLSKNKNNK